MTTIKLPNGGELFQAGVGRPKFYFLHDKLHREDGPAVEFANGDKYWFLNDILHREDGPALECINGDKQWYISGICHRIDGPAIEYATGRNDWYLQGKKISKKKHSQLVKLKAFW
jgi:hypothetical protein